MFNKRRGEIEIIGEILDLSQKGAKKTEILYKNNMSFIQLNNYLSLLKKKEIIREDLVPNDDGQTLNSVYVTTEKGNHLLNDINKILSYFE